MAKILIKFNAAIIQEVELKKDVTTFGRKPGNDIVINHPAVSGFHGKINKEGEGFNVEDLKSTNGTFLNGRKVTTASLADKDNIRVAKHILEINLSSEPAKVINPENSEPESQPSTPSTTEAQPPSTEAPPSSPDKNVEDQKEMLRKSLGISKDSPPVSPQKPVLQDVGKAEASSPQAPKPQSDVGTLKIISGGVDGQKEVHLKELVTYIGSSDQAAIKIKGFLAPSLAAAISRRPEGYFLKAIKSGYPKVNGANIKEQTLLENGALLECGGTNMVFYFNDGKKKEEKKPSQNA